MIQKNETLSERINGKVHFFLKQLQTYVDRFWYPPLTGLLAALDNFLIFIPTDGILISSVLLTPKRWPILALSVTIGSTLGALLLALFVKTHGLPWILEFYPHLNETKTWALSAEFFDKYGLFLVFGISITPFFQQPAVILAGLASTPLIKLATVIFIGRVIKFLILAYISSYAPHWLKKMWGLKDELKKIELKTK